MLMVPDASMRPVAKELVHGVAAAPKSESDVKPAGSVPIHTSDLLAARNLLFEWGGREHNTRR
jgi:hypothetical protein